MKEKLLYHITTAEAKKHLRIDSGYTFDDDEIENIIHTSYFITEDYIGKDIAKTKTTKTIYEYSGDKIEISEGNFIEISGITDEDGNDLSYKVEKIYNSSFLIELDNNVNNKDITIVYITGYDENKIPLSLERAILIKIADLYDIERTNYIGGNTKKSDVYEILLRPYVFNDIKIINN